MIKVLWEFLKIKTRISDEDLFKLQTDVNNEVDRRAKAQKNNIEAGTGVKHG